LAAVRYADGVRSIAICTAYYVNDVFIPIKQASLTISESHIHRSHDGGGPADRDEGL
jgi:hypothetical protein